MTFGICFKQHFDTRYLVFYNPSPPRMFLPWTLFQIIGFNMVPSDPFMSHLATQLGYSAGGVSGFATDYLCGVWCRMVYLFFCILPYAIIYALIHHIIFLALSLLLKYSFFFKNSCTNIFHVRSLCTIKTLKYQAFKEERNSLHAW